MCSSGIFFLKLLWVSIVYFVDLIEINKKICDGNLPISLFWASEGAQGSKIAYHNKTKILFQATLSYNSAFSRS